MIKGVLDLLPIVHILNSQVIARCLAQSRTSRRLCESDERQHMQNNQINSNEQPNKYHEMIRHDFRKFWEKDSLSLELK